MVEGNGTKILGTYAKQILGWMGAALGGALLSMMLRQGGQDERLNALERLILSNGEAIATLQSGYATNKRVDDLQAEVRSNYRDLKGSVDNVLTILIQRNK